AAPRQGRRRAARAMMAPEESSVPRLGVTTSEATCRCGSPRSSVARRCAKGSRAVPAVAFRAVQGVVGLGHERVRRVVAFGIARGDADAGGAAPRGNLAGMRHAEPLDRFADTFHRADPRSRVLPFSMTRNSSPPKR